MLKKLLIIGCSLFSVLSAESRIEAKGSYFFFDNHTMRKIYNNGGYELQLSGSIPWDYGLHIYGSVGYLHAEGKSTNFHQKTTLWQIPVDLGLKKIISITPCLDWYGALGPRYFYVHQHNRSDFVNKKISKNGVGLFVNTGLDYFPTCDWFITIFGEYSYERIKPSAKHGVYKRDIQVGGFNFGAGLGYIF